MGVWSFFFNDFSPQALAIICHSITRFGPGYIEPICFLCMTFTNAMQPGLFSNASLVSGMMKTYILPP
jgi:hypothetical protein